MYKIDMDWAKDYLKGFGCEIDEQQYDSVSPFIYRVILHDELFVGNAREFYAFAVGVECGKSIIH